MAEIYELWHRTADDGARCKLGRGTEHDMCALAELISKEQWPELWLVDSAGNWEAMK